MIRVSRGSMVGPGKSGETIVVRERALRAVRCREYAVAMCV